MTAETTFSFCLKADARILVNYGPGALGNAPLATTEDDMRNLSDTEIHNTITMAI